MRRLKRFISILLLLILVTLAGLYLLRHSLSYLVSRYIAEIVADEFNLPIKYNSTTLTLSPLTLTFHDVIIKNDTEISVKAVSATVTAEKLRNRIVEISQLEFIDPSIKIADSNSALHKIVKHLMAQDSTKKTAPENWKVDLKSILFRSSTDAPSLSYLQGSTKALLHGINLKLYQTTNQTNPSDYLINVTDQKIAVNLPNNTTIIGLLNLTGDLSNPQFSFKGDLKSKLPPLTIEANGEMADNIITFKKLELANSIGRVVAKGLIDLDNLEKLKLNFTGDLLQQLTTIIPQSLPFSFSGDNHRLALTTKLPNLTINSSINLSENTKRIECSGEILNLSILDYLPTLKEKLSELKLTGKYQLNFDPTEFSTLQGEINVDNLSALNASATNPISLKNRTPFLLQLQNQALSFKGVALNTNYGDALVSGSYQQNYLKVTDLIFSKYILKPNPNTTLELSGNLNLEKIGEDLPLVSGKVIIDHASYNRSVTVLQAYEFLKNYLLTLGKDRKIDTPKDPSVLPEESEFKFKDLILQTATPAEIKTNLAEISVNGDLVINGDPKEPNLGGKIILVKGNFGSNLLKFNLLDGSVNFDPEKQIKDATLDISAEGTQRSLTRDTDIGLSITGTLFEPKIKFSSDSALSQIEILSLVSGSLGLTTLSLINGGNRGTILQALTPSSDLTLLERLETIAGFDTLNIGTALSQRTGEIVPQVYGERAFIGKSKLELSAELPGSQSSQVSAIYPLSDNKNIFTSWINSPSTTDPSASSGAFEAGGEYRYNPYSFRAALNTQDGLHLRSEYRKRELGDHNESLVAGVDGYFKTGGGVFDAGRARIQFVRPDFAPDIFGEKCNFLAEGFIQNAIELIQSYSFDRIGGSLHLRAPLEQSMFYDLGATAYAERLFDVDQDVRLGANDSGSNFFSILSSELRLDRRDSELNPRRGYLSLVEGKLSSNLLTSEFDYWGLKTQHSIFKPISDRFVWANNFRVNYLSPFSDTSSIPISQRFFLGGQDSLRGFTRNVIGPRGAQGHIVGGDLSLVINTEARYDLYDDLTSVLFLDVGQAFLEKRGNLENLDSRLDLNKLRYSPGIGFRYKTPIGPLSIDYGAALDRENGERFGRLNLGLGGAF